MLSGITGAFMFLAQPAGVSLRDAKSAFKPSSPPTPFGATHSHTHRFTVELSAKPSAKSCAMASLRACVRAEVADERETEVKLHAHSIPERHAAPAKKRKKQSPSYLTMQQQSCLDPPRSLFTKSVCVVCDGRLCGNCFLLLSFLFLFLLLVGALLNIRNAIPLFSSTANFAKEKQP